MNENFCYRDGWAFNWVVTWLPCWSIKMLSYCRRVSAAVTFDFNTFRLSNGMILCCSVFTDCRSMMLTDGLLIIEIAEVLGIFCWPETICGVWKLTLWLGKGIS